MSVSRKPNVIIDILIELETRIGELYKRFADMFQEYGDFWRSIASQEEKHARILKSCHSPNFNEGGLSIESARALLSYVRRQSDDIQKRNISIEDALSVAFNIENSVIEKAF